MTDRFHVHLVNPDDETVVERHLCNVHYHAWRDGEREGPARVLRVDDCHRGCDGCRKASRSAAKRKPAKASSGKG